MLSIKKLLNLAFYTSGLDEFLAKFDKEHPRQSASQRREEAKYRRIYKLRDDPNQPEAKKSFWDRF